MRVLLEIRVLLKVSLIRKFMATNFHMVNPGENALMIVDANPIKPCFSFSESLKSPTLLW